MKLSVSLPEEDIATLDAYVKAAGLPSRSAALHHAVRLLREADLESDYEAAWEEWESSGDQAAWAVADADGTVDAPR
jgi:Arc/MetJ-type ribon-helix-helix transcriptional regulator